MIAPQQPALAAIVGNDMRISSSGNDATGRQTGGASSIPVLSSQNSIALVGDGDCHALSGVGRGDRVFDSQTIWGMKDGNRSNGIYGFGVQNEAARYYDGSNVGAGQTNGSKAWFASNSGFMTGFIQNGPGYAGSDGGSSTSPGWRTAQTQSFGVNSVAIGCDARANGYGAYANGWGAWATGAGSNAFGINSRATGQGSLALGIAAQATAEDSIAQGSLAKASNKSTIAIGALTTASGTNSTAIGAGDTEEGTGAQALGDNTVAFGYKAMAFETGAVALGSQSSAKRAAGLDGYHPFADANAASAAASDPTWQASSGAVAVGNADNGITRQITDVAAGTANTDAVNVAQLKAIETYSARTDRFTSSVFGSGADVDKEVYPTYTIQGTITNNVGTTFEQVDRNLTNIQKSLSDISKNAASPVRRLNDTDILVLTGKDGDATNPGNTQKLTNLADGTDKNDAVNFGQLSATNDSVAQNTADIKTNTSNISANKAAIDTNRADFDAAVKNANSYLGGGADIGKGTAPAYTIQGTITDNIGDAFTAIDDNFDTVNNNVTALTDNINHGSIGAVRRFNNDDVLTLTDANNSEGAAQTLTNLADGKNAADAVNFGQLSATNSTVAQNTADIKTNTSNISANKTAIDANKTTITQNRADFDAAVKNANTYLGGGADIGKGTAPSYTVQGKIANNVGDAFANVDSAFNTVNSSINAINTNINNGTVGPVRRLSASDVLTLTGADGTAGKAQTLTNIADGKNTADAVNFGQLSATNSTVAQVKSSIDSLADTAIRYDDKNKEKITLSGKSGTKITNLQLGEVSATSTDAVTGAQINTAYNGILQNKADITIIKSAANQYFGGGTDISKGAAPTYTIQSKTAHNVGDAFTTVDSTLTALNDTVTNNKKDADTKFGTVNGAISTLTTNINNASIGPVRRLNNNDVLTLTGSDGTAGTAQKLTNLADGTDKNDAVNFGQLSATNSTVAQNTADIKTNTSNISANKTAIDANKTTITQNRTDFDKSVANANSYLGGGADIAAGKAPAYTVQSKTAANVGDAFANVDSTFNAVNDSIKAINTNINNGTVGPVRRLSSGDVLTLTGTDGTASTAQKLTNLADGTDKNDAVNFGQLSATNSTVAQNTADIKTNKTNISANKTAIDTNRADFDKSIANANSYLGGGADIAAGKAPSYTVQGKAANNVGDAFANVDSSFNTVNDSITEINNNLSNGTIGPVRRLNDNDVLSLVNKDGKTDTAQKITNLADGTNAADAVTFGQLSATNSTVAQNTKSIADNKADADSRFDTVNQSVSANKTAIDTNRADFDAAVKNANTYLGGGADIAAGKAPSYTVQGKIANNVGDAFANVDSTFNAVNETITNNKKDADDKFTEINNNISNGSVGPVRRLNNNDVLTLTGSDGTAGTAQKLTNLADGTNAADAVNFGQLSATNSTVAQNTKSITDNKADADSRFDTVNQSVSANKTAIDANKTTITQNRADFDKSITNANTYLGGGADIAAGKAPSYTVQGKTAANVSDAFANVDSTFNTVNDSIKAINTNINNGSVGPVRRLNNDDVLSLVNKDGKTDTAQKITNLADGTNAADAVNFGQLSATNSTVAQNTKSITDNKADADSRFDTVNQSVSANKTTITQNRADFDKSIANANSYLGGGADILAGTAPAYTVQGKTAANVSDAFANVDSTFNTVNETITNNKKDADDKFTEINNNISNGSIGPVRRLNNNNVLTLTGSDGTAGTAQKLTNLADGTNTSDAVNFGQLSATNSNVTQNTADIKTNTSNISANKTAIDANKTTITQNRTDFDAAVKNANTYLGGGADIAAGKAPSYTVQGKAAANVGDAFANVDSTFNTVNETITNNKKDADDKFTEINNNISNGSIGPVRRLNNNDVLTLTGSDGTAGTPQKLTNLADGTDKNDAVNFGQLSATNSTVTQNTADIKTNTANISANKTAIDTNRADFDKSVANANSYLGGGADIAAGKAPSYTVQGKAANNVGDAFANVDSSFNTVNDSINAINTNINNGTVGPVRRLSSGDVLTLTGSDGTAGTPQKLTNLADGTNTSDAVNFGQLQQVKDSFDALSDLSVLYDDKNKDRLTLAGKSGTKITNLQAGNISANSTDAVTGSQLFAANSLIETGNKQIAAYLGGGANYQNGQWTAPSYTIRSIDSTGQATSAKHNTVGDALGAIDQSLGNVNSRVDAVNQTVKDEIGKIQENGLRWNENEKAYDAAGKGSSANKILNVADGKVEKDSKDAVNAGQLFDTNQRVGAVEGRVDGLEGRIDQIGSISKNVVAYDTDDKGNRKNSISLQGADASQPVALHNVADGKVEKGSTDAVNGGQLQTAKDELNTSIADKANETLKNANAYTDKRIKDISGGSMEEANRYTDRQFGRLNSKINDVRKEARTAAAIGLAAASLRYEDVPGALSIGFGSGYWKDESALSFGAGYTDGSGRVRSTVTGTFADGTVGIGAGITFRLTSGRPR